MRGYGHPLHTVTSDSNLLSDTCLRAADNLFQLYCLLFIPKHIQIMECTRGCAVQTAFSVPSQSKPCWPQPSETLQSKVNNPYYPEIPITG